MSDTPRDNPALQFQRFETLRLKLSQRQTEELLKAAILADPRNPGFTAGAAVTLNVFNRNRVEVIVEEITAGAMQTP